MEKGQFTRHVILNGTKWSEESLFILYFNIRREILRFAQNDSIEAFSTPPQAHT